METRGIEEAAGEIEVFYPSLKNDQQQANPITAEKQKRRKAKKFAGKKIEKSFAGRHPSAIGRGASGNTTPRTL